MCQYGGQECQSVIPKKETLSFSGIFNFWRIFGPRTAENWMEQILLLGGWLARGEDSAAQEVGEKVSCHLVALSQEGRERERDDSKLNI